MIQLNILMRQVISAFEAVHRFGYSTFYLIFLALENCIGCGANQNHIEKDEKTLYQVTK